MVGKCSQMLRLRASQDKLSQVYRVPESNWTKRVWYQERKQLGLLWICIGSTRPTKGQ